MRIVILVRAIRDPCPCEMLQMKGIVDVWSRSVRIRLDQVEQVVATDVDRAYFDAFVETVCAVAIRIGPDTGRSVRGNPDRTKEGRVRVAVGHGRDDGDAWPVCGGQRLHRTDDVLVERRSGW